MPNNAPEQTYEAATTRADEILAKLDSGDVPLREQLELIREASAMIAFCHEELEAVSGEIEELRLGDLVERLKGEEPGERR